MTKYLLSLFNISFSYIFHFLNILGRFNMKIISFFMIFATYIFAKDITGFYLLPKDSKERQSVVEIFSKNNKFYGVGFTTTKGINNDLDSKNPNPSMRSRHVRGSVFLELECSNMECKGNIYSFEKGKTYPTKVVLRDNKLEFAINVLFGPTFIWEKLNDMQMMPYQDERLDTSKLNTKL